jgi:hypothetical protein
MYTTEIICCEQIGFNPGKQEWFNIFKSLKFIKYITRSKEKNHTIISIDVEEAFHDKTSDEVKNRWKVLKHNKNYT